MIIGQYILQMADDTSQQLNSPTELFNLSTYQSSTTPQEYMSPSDLKKECFQCKKVSICVFMRWCFIPNYTGAESRIYNKELANNCLYTWQWMHD